MGKPFSKELERINDSLVWSMQIDIKNFSNFISKYNCPIYIVGSGGSLSACYYAVSLAASIGKIAQAITPLELFSVRKALNKSAVIFISASGKNNDILFGLKTVIHEEPKGIACICMVEDSPLIKLAKQYTICEVFQYALPTGKDGFLATNSLIAFYTILCRAFNNDNLKPSTFWNKKSETKEIEYFIDQIDSGFTFFVLYSGWGSSVAIDIESKCTEAALGNTTYSDYRNFGHGRHHWFAKRKNKSAIIALITPQEEELAKKTLGNLPSEIPRLILKSEINNAWSSIELLIKSFYFINDLGKIQDIDPGKPGVPEFGRKLYNLKYQSIYTKNRTYNFSEKCDTAIRRKLRTNSLQDIPSEKLLIWKNCYENYITLLNRQDYGSVIFDYDGTLCSSLDRFSGLSNNISSELLKILSMGFIVGVVTGRGKSVKESLRLAIPNKNYWSNIIIGYYNGSQIGTLESDSFPDVSGNINESLVNIRQILDSTDSPFELEYTLRPNQLTIEIKKNEIWDIVKLYIVQKIKSAQINDIQILESSHSIDVIPNCTSKTDIIKICRSRASELSKSIGCLCIGDKGQWPGNDFKLLDNSYSLSVDETSPDPNSGWNLSPLGIKNVDSTIEYLKCLTFEEKRMKIIIHK